MVSNIKSGVTQVVIGCSAIAAYFLGKKMSLLYPPTEKQAFYMLSGSSAVGAITYLTTCNKMELSTKLTFAIPTLLATTIAGYAVTGGKFKIKLSSTIPALAAGGAAMLAGTSSGHPRKAFISGLFLAVIVGRVTITKVEEPS